MATFSMATFSKVVFLVMLLSSSGHPFSYLKTEVRFGLTGEEATFPILPDLYVTPARYEAFLYRLTLNGSVLLKNSSDPSQSYGSERPDRVSCFYAARDAALSFVLWNLSLSDSGEYMTETWANGTYRDWTLYKLTVCAGRVETRKEEFEEAIEWTLSDVSVGQGDILQMYAQNMFKPSCPPKKGMSTLILDTQRSFGSLESDLNVTVESLSNGSSIRIWNVRRFGGRVCSHILRWRADECHLHSERACTFLFGRTASHLHFLKAGERFALACSPRVPTGPALWSTPHGPRVPAGPALWSTPHGPLSSRVPSGPSEEVEADVSVSSVRNETLVVSAVTPAHAGRYCCSPEGRPQERSSHRLFVCHQLTPRRLAIAWADSVELRCDVEAETFSIVQWYRLRGQEPEDLLLEVDDSSTGRIHEDLGGRVTFSRRSLTISGLRAEGAGLYRCRLWQGLNRRDVSCFEGTVELVSMGWYCVHALLLGFGLLGMICALTAVTVGLRGHQRSSAE